jgi:hypothetical protein
LERRPATAERQNTPNHAATVMDRRDKEQSLDLTARKLAGCAAE